MITQTLTSVKTISQHINENSTQKLEPMSFLEIRKSSSQISNSHYEFDRLVQRIIKFYKNHNRTDKQLSKNIEYSKDLMNNVKLCLIESLNNALIHGCYKLAQTRPRSRDEYWQYIQDINKCAHLPSRNHNETIKIKASLQCHTITLSISDQGDGFDYQKKLQNLKLLDRKKPLQLYTGRGLYLISELCSQLSFSDKGRTINMMWFI
jgi:anti-sigma regulatory factor (Ser/Thr protein kinase)